MSCTGTPWRTLGEVALSRVHDSTTPGPLVPAFQHTPPLQFCLTFFLGVMGWVLTGFLGYHIFLILSGTTTNEASKWRALRKDLARQAAFDPAGLHLDLAPDNAYDWGPGRNLLDALVPRVPCTKDSKLC